MCTVTFVPSAKGVIITSNRDELALRPHAAMPAWEQWGGGRIFFPKDGLAGGTWIGMHENGAVMVLLNGAFARHEHLPPYRRSRGLVFLDILGDTDPTAMLNKIELDGIEPFTVLLWQSPRLTELRWDGRQRYIKALPLQAGIWSSAMLYDPEVIRKREAWFNTWKETHPAPDAEALKSFHTFTGDGDPENDLLMNRNGRLRTLSITSIDWSPAGAAFAYQDLLTGQDSREQVVFSSAAFPG